MTAASSNRFPSVTFNPTGGIPAAPTSSDRKLYYSLTSNAWYSVGSNGSSLAVSTGGSGNVATDPIWTAAGDLAVGTGNSAAAKLSSGASNTFLVSLGAGVTPKWSSASLPTFATVDATLAADVAMTSANTPYDGPSASFAAGTWFIWYRCVLRGSTTSATHDFTVKLWDGATIYDEVSNSQPTATTSQLGCEVVGFAIATLGSTTTLKLTAFDVRTGSTMSRDVVDNSASFHTATRMTGIKVA